MNNFSIFTAIVSDNQDPDSLHRVQITWQDKEETVSAWAPVITPFGGADTGVYMLPDIDQEVLAAAEAGNHKDIYVIGTMWSSVNAPPSSGENGNADLNSDGTNSLKFVKSRSGNMIILDDTDGAEKIQIIASDSSSRLEFDPANELVNMETGVDMMIGASKGIALNAEEINMTASKQLNISGDEIQIKGADALDITADQDISLSGSGIALN